MVVRLVDPANGAALRDAQVHVELENTESHVVLGREATHRDAGNPVDYVAHMQLDQPGSYRASIRVQSPGGSAEAAFDQRILAPRQGSTLVLLGLPFALALGVLAVVWFVRSAPSSASVAKGNDL